MAQTTKLEAVNTMLTAIGETPVNSLTSGLVDAATALTILEDTSRAVQAKGWHFNKEDKYEIVPTAAGEIVLPANCLKVDGASVLSNGDLDLIQRGQRLYDRKNHTFNIGQAVKVDMVVLLDFEELPEAARNYVTIRAARIFQDRTVGSDTLHGFQERDEMNAWIELLDMELDTADPTIFDNYTVARTLDRSPGYYRGIGWL